MSAIAPSSTTQNLKKIPDVPSKPLIGQIGPFFQDRFSLLERVGQEYGEICRLRVGPLPVVYVNSPELVYELLVDRPYDFLKGAMQARVFRAVLGNALNTVEAEFHQKQRKLLAPVFQMRHLTTFSDTIVEYGERVPQRWQDGQSLDLVGGLLDLALEIIGKILFDQADFGPQDPLWDAVKTGTAYLDYQGSRLVPLPLSLPTKFNRQVKAQLEVLNSRIYAAIAERKRAGSEQIGDLLSMMLHARYEDGSHMSDQQLRDETVSAFIASYDNTGTALAWTIYLLAQNPTAYATLQEEVDRVLGDRPATFADLARLTYTTQTLKEAQRIYPTTSMAARQVPKDEVQSQLGGYRLNRGEFVILSPLLIQRRPDFFPDPMCFDPTRFTPENERAMPRCTYLPFSTGPRTCIGNHFTMLENTLLLATLTKYWTFELKPGQKVEPVTKAILRAKDGIGVIARRRTRPQ